MKPHIAFHTFSQNCTWECAKGYKAAAGNLCLDCLQFLQSTAAAGLYPPPPAVGGIWNDTDGGCNAESWACAPGFRRSPAGARYCCPLAIPHSSSLSGEGGGPCGVGCDAGFWWNSAAANCSQCDGSLLPANAAWVPTAAADGQARIAVRYSVRQCRILFPICSFQSCAEARHFGPCSRAEAPANRDIYTS